MNPEVDSEKRSRRLFMRKSLIQFFIMTTFLVPLAAAQAEIPSSSNTVPVMSQESKMQTARQMMERIAKKFADADRQLKFKDDPVGAQIAGIPENEELFLQIYLRDDLLLDAPILSRVENGELLLSLRDFLLILEFPIDVNMQMGKATGWYIKEDNNFALDSKVRTVQTPKGQFAFSETVRIEDNDIFVPYKEIARWFGFGLTPDIANLNLALNSSTPLPVEDRLRRQGKLYNPKTAREGPVQPRLADENPARSYPLVDVSTTTSYTKPGERSNDDDKGFAGSAYIRTAGDIAGGTLVTQSSLDDTEHLTNFRATFSEQSLEPELLGPLKARRYELGDINSPVLPLRVRNNNGVGARVSNISPNRSTILPVTEIRGTSFPNWDVELYRNNQLLGVQTVQDDGIYAFENVDLFGSDNNFLLVFYGPQGERREEEVNIPVDTKRRARDESVYDIAVMSQDKQLYRKYDNASKDAGAVAATAYYETPLGEMSAATLGFEAGEKNEEQVYAAHAGVSTIAGGALLNLDGAVDQNQEVAAQLVARRDIGAHKLRNETRVNTDRYGLSDEQARDITVAYNRLALNGPLPFGIGARPRYNLSLGVGVTGSGELAQDYVAGYNDNIFQRIGLNQQIISSTTDNGNDDDDTLRSVTSLSGSLGKNRLRMTANYLIEPDNRLDALQASYTRDINEVLDFSLSAGHRTDPKFTQGTAQVDWRAGFADISPSLSYNSDKEAIAMLNTRFGLLRDPISSQIKSFEESVTANGGVSVFVFLDKNGDNIFNGDDEPVQDATVRMPQNGGEEVTDEKGQIMFTRLLNMRPTDIYVQEDTLTDPYWISGHSGFSIVPREGHIVKVEFPIHIGGEIDGTVFVQDADGANKALRGVKLSLYDFDGKKVRSAVSESDGFYLLERVPPGRYMLAVDNNNFDGPYGRPKPQPILVKSTGSTMYGNNIFLRENSPDVQVVFYDDAKTLKLDPSATHGRGVFLNLGEYKSQLTLGLAWFKIRNLFKNEMADMELLERPSESVADVKTNSHTLRLFSYSDDMSEAYNKCKVLNANGQKCTVEVIPDRTPAARVATVQ